MEILRYKELDYVLRLPKAFDEKEKYPLVIYIHGAGSRGRNIDVIVEHPFMIETAEVLSEVVSVAPQCYADSWFDIFEQLQDFVKMTIDLPYIDASRVYILGASMGAYTTWQLLMAHPDWFAAAAPICGGGMYWNAARLKNIPIWAFHGDIDRSVFTEESRKMVDAVNKYGGNAKLTIWENTAHNAWTPAFRHAPLWEWMFSQRNTNAAATEKSEYDNVQQYG